MSSRIAMLSEMLPDSADAAIILSNENRRYLTGFVSSLGHLLVTREESYLLVDSRYSEAARQQAQNCTVIAYRQFREELVQLIREKKLHHILLEGSAFTLNNAAYMETILHDAEALPIKTDELDRLLGKMRLIKTAEEVGKMRKAQQITEDALTATLKLIKEGVTEKDLALELEFRMRRAGADSVSFDLIALAGKKTSMPHGVPDDNRVHNGDLLLFDIGATVDGYHSDMTRTFAFGKIGSEEKRVYETVRQAQQNALDTVREGVSCGSVDHAARSYIAQAGYEGFFGHSTGHGVGLAIHEDPSVSPDSAFILRQGMVVTVEPGIYLPGKFGVRIEDMVMVTKNGCMNLASLPKELTIL